jgi:hypothetical protein
MVTIREFEDAAGRLAEQAKIPGTISSPAHFRTRSE